MSAVSAMANAPQNVTRITPRTTPAPPVIAANAPSEARNSNEVPETIGMMTLTGASAALSSGSAAPTPNVSAEANAACSGRAA